MRDNTHRLKIKSSVRFSPNCDCHSLLLQFSMMLWKSQNLDVCLSEGNLPEAGRKYWVQCKDCRCLAVVDKSGVWKSFYTGNVLADFIKVVDAP